MLRRYPALGLLSLAQALYWSCSIIGIALTGLMGQKLTPWPMLATLPLTLLVVGNLLAIGRLARWMQQCGRSIGLQRGAALGVLAGLAAAAALYLQSFALFCAAMLLLGGYQASSGFYRFAALDGVDAQHKGRAASWVVGGGILAALLAPSLALQAQNWLSVAAAGAYLCIAVLAACAMVLLRYLPDAASPAAPPQSGMPATLKAQRKALLQRPAIRQALVVTACGHGLMILVMNATPLAMHGLGMSLAHSTHVIQWHVLGMFAPSLLAGPAIDKLGARRVAWLGTALLATSATLALSGLSQTLFLASSLLLGAGWNLMLLAGTTLLSQAHTPDERAAAQPLMEWSNNGMAAAMSLSCGVLVQTLGWEAINLAALLVIAVLALWMWRSPRAGAAAVI
ncbi:MFS transporter [Comamonas testosteroni]|uniref:MFS transporter n=1 Tax=Comamonas testosteroni TaxID=285 RepID=A0A373FHQ4_COMTE|nr:MFS transporter [Comamonas testosteroni]RGE43678.1 MFS transporter [Comamonas testosteroni]